MIWLTWRQHRITISALAAIFLGFAAWFVLLGNGMRGSLTTDSLANCVTMRFECGEWSSAISGLHELQGALLPMLPALIGIFLGAPMLSREFEQRTLRYAWTQGISRSHWLRAKLALLGAVILVLSTAFSGAYMWLFQPAAQQESWFDAYNQAFPVFPAMCLFGFVLGVAAGTASKRLLVSMSIALAGFLAVFLPIVAWLRSSYMSPELVVSEKYYDGETAGWVTDFVYVGTSGAHYNMVEAAQRAGIGDLSQGVGSKSIEQLRQAGFTEMVAMQPAGRFWSFQFIEASVFLVLAAGCVALTFWLLRRKAV